MNDHYYLQLNICGAVADCTGADTAACLGDQTLGKVRKTLELGNTGILRLSYVGTRTDEGTCTLVLIGVMLLATYLSAPL